MSADTQHTHDPGSRSHEAHDASRGHDKHEGHSPQMFRDKFWLSLLFTLPVVFWSAHIQDLVGYEAPEFPGSAWVPPVLGTVVFLYGGLVFLRGAWRELRDRLPGMMTLISLAIVVAFVFSWVVQLGLIDANALWWELASLVTVMLLGHWIEMRSISQAQGALKELAKLLPDMATRGTDSGEETVPVSELKDGDLVLVRPGESVPADGVVRKGESDLDEAMITGESRPVRKTEGDEVIAATINGEGALRVEVTGTGEHTKLSGIMRLVADAQTSKSRTQHLADRAARILTGVAIVAAVITLVAWQIVGARLDPRPRGDGSGHRLPPRPRSRRAPRGGHFHHTWRPQRPPGAGSAGSGRGQEPEHRDLRQDRHPHPRRVPGGGDGRDGGHSRGGGAPDRGGCRVGIAASHCTGDREDGGGPGTHRPLRRGLPGHHRQGSGRLGGWDRPCGE